jgi:hypothetical protein
LRANREGERRKGWFLPVDHLAETVYVVHVYEAVLHDPAALVVPKADEHLRLAVVLSLAQADALEHVGEVAQVELVMELSVS